MSSSEPFESRSYHGPTNTDWRKDTYCVTLLRYPLTVSASIEPPLQGRNAVGVVATVLLEDHPDMDAALVELGKRIDAYAAANKLERADQ